MRVAIVSESFLPTVNGVTTSVLRVLEQLAALGHEAIVICPDAGAPAEYAGFRIHQVPSIAYRQFPVGLPSPQVQRILARFAPDVLHAASPFFLGAQAIAAANRLGVPSVAVYQTDVAGFARRNGFGMTSAIAGKYVAWVHEGADVTLAPSAASEYDLRTAGVKPLGRWGRGVDLERYHPNNRTARAAVELRERLSPHGETVVGYVGRVAPEKQVERLASLRGLPGVSVAIVGDGPSLPAVSEALSGMEVAWLGRLSGADLAAAYAAFDVFVHTGSEETFGQTVQEAHASGLPVVAPRAGGPIDLVDHGVDGLLFPQADDRALRAAVSMLVRDAPLRLRMGEAGRRAVLGRGWDVLVAELIRYYEHVIVNACTATAQESGQRTRRQRAYS
ncbi:glucosyltransferase [Leifsonia xyli subsp. cynodontis DSM 46306]|uniref:D-inositol 3-phosphate glycosyltransferase n=1 Tax=Leifsonia xyli subsp. cynodontis DSM 46306 TaxID=1389489 RepID=U3P4H1_LEIXC|nr:glycosyltransferase family 1 protein [Leifsonia xyli]AGW40661.1 glucosyltransferase [Leifsonia xyli subsp. cynodontis DSM 46306]